MSRLPNPIETLKGEDKEIYEKMVHARGRVDGMYASLLNHPNLTEKVSDLGAFLRFNGSLPGNYREFVILYCAKTFDVEYEWMKHLHPAKNAGLGEEIIQEIKTGNNNFSDPFSLFIEIIQCAIQLKTIPEPLQNSVITLVGVKGLLEIVILANFYRMIAGVITCFDVPLPPKE